MRVIWKGSINFGLVSIPIGVYPATREERVSFRQLRARDLSPIKYKKVAEADQKEVAAEDIVKGYEYEKGKWVTLREEDFEKVRIESTHSIEITDFIDQTEVNPKFFHKPYFLEPQKGGERGYTLLHKALTETGKIGIAKVCISNREYLAAVKPDGLFLILELMHFASEVLEPGTLKPATADVSARELSMAKMLIENMSATWDPGKYQDQYHSAVMEMIDDKIKRRPPKSNVAPPPAASSVVDLVAVLQESLGKAAASRSRSKKPRQVVEREPQRRKKGRSAPKKA